MESDKPWWWNQYFSPYSEDHQKWYDSNKENITTMEKTTNITDDYDSINKIEPHTRRTIYSGKGIPKTTFTESV